MRVGVGGSGGDSERIKSDLLCCLFGVGLFLVLLCESERETL